MFWVVEKMKDILIFSQAMEIGGAERALLGLLENIDTTKYKVDLFLMRHQGELMKYIPDSVNLLPELPQYASLAVPITNVLKKGQVRVALERLIGKQKAKKRVQDLGLPQDNDVALEYSHKYTVNAMPRIGHKGKKYDLAVSFLTPHYFVAEKVAAKKKIAWIHTDYSVVAVDRESQLDMWGRYDAIASISDKVTYSFVKTFPELKEKVQIIQNIMPTKYMEALKNEFGVEDEMPSHGCIKLLSIGRFCTAKNFDNVPMICKLIRDKGLDVKWYLIGYGGDEELIKSKIAEAGMQQYVIMLGKKENPYPYIRACDIYVQPSRYEGKCVSVIEAQILNKPVVITNYATANSQLVDGVDGIIVPLDNEGCATAIENLIRDVELKKQLIENTKQHDYTYLGEVRKIYQIIES